MSEVTLYSHVSMQNFQNLVLEKSINKPILVDFWQTGANPAKPSCQCLPSSQRNMRASSS